MPAGGAEIPLGIELVLAYCALGAMAVVPIYVGSVLSLAAIGPGGVTKSEEGEVTHAEAMTADDAKMFPIIGSGVLITLFVLFKVFKLKEYVNYVLTAYFVGIGILAIMSAFVKPLLLQFAALRHQDETEYEIKINLTPWNSSAEKTSISFTNLDLMALAVSSVAGVWYAVYKHWVANNLVALAFAIEGTRSLSIGSFSTATILLCGLFVYDIFHVFYSHLIFGSSTMVEVARGLQAPIAVKFPRAVLTNPSSNLSLLGLGDIVIPGIVIAMLLRFDAFRSNGQSRLYFWPALLYLVPAVLGASLLTAAVRGELGELYAYSEGEDEAAKSVEADDADGEDAPTDEL
ncbi:signal peptide peptidase [Thecamonas trahens ATCC 50062]|uniref:Signal peptide peptidase n=1 Tax=Thecamonas trahens ATCC 50062 TaxID=461836 RepID=A0A0L0D431_THETB|nr:signal peptide peptidase [Thecamonas trahens ATCC 50062]KNC47102.1 signal peptide peptidase [Thecamonas trahens ATCC 50062]|eukprot:XP_013759879.1 signal peptide peptidase [Thecamonas trahens ATCC 50062]